MNHRWEKDALRFDSNTTYRFCIRCPMVKISRHESDLPVDQQHWFEWVLADTGKEIHCNKTPACQPIEEAMKKPIAETIPTYRLVEVRADNYTKLKAVRIKIDGSMLKINGRNEQGKSSVLNAVAAAIAGPKAFPAEPIRKGEERAEIALDFGDLKLTRRLWKTESGRVAQDVTLEFSDGRRPKDKQTVLDALRGSAIADDPIAFARMDPKKRYDLLKTLVPGYNFAEKAKERIALFEDRTIVGREFDRLKGAVEAVKLPLDAPTTSVDVTELAAKLRAAGEHNAAVRRADEQRERVSEQAEEMLDEADKLERQAVKLREEAGNMKREIAEAEDIPAPTDTASIEAQIANAQTINTAAQQAYQRNVTMRNRDEKSAEYDRLSAEIKALDDEKIAAIESAKLPIEDLTFGDDDILLDGLPFDQASTARKIRVSTALLMAMKPDLRVLLVREGSLLDDEARAALQADAEANDFVVLMECVGNGDGSGIVIEDGEVVT